MSTDIAFRLRLADLCEARDEALRLARIGAEHMIAAASASRRATPRGGGFLSLFDDSSLRELAYCTSTIEVDSFLEEVRVRLDTSVWWHLLHASELTTVMGAGAKKRFEDQLKTKVPEIKLEDVRATLQSMMGNARAILAEGVVDLFKRLSKEHKTNDRFTIGAKFILDYAVDEDRGFGQSFHVSSYGPSARDHLIDLERQLLLLRGEKPPSHDDTIAAKISHLLRDPPGGVRIFETDLLRVRWFKKGTMHVEIKNQEDVAMVNRIIAEHYGEVLPEGHSAAPGDRYSAAPPKPVKQTAIAADVLEVLRRGRVEGNRYFLPPEQLQRAQYDAVNKVLVDLGGRWSRQQRAHVMPEDAIGRLLAVIDGGSYTRPADMGQFFTPPELAAKVVELAEIKPGMSVLEPSAGDGALLRELPEARVHAVELDQALAERLKEAGTLPGNIKATPQRYPAAPRVWEGDFLAIAPERFNQAFDRVVMNPPYANGAVPDHVIAAWNCLKPGGRLVAILPPAWQSRQDRKHGFLRALIEQFEGTWTDNPPGSFKAAGTDVATGILVLDKPAAQDPAPPAPPASADDQPRFL